MPTLFELLVDGDSVEVSTIGQLKAAIADLPDDLTVWSLFLTYNGDSFEYELFHPVIFLDEDDMIVTAGTVQAGEARSLIKGGVI